MARSTATPATGSAADERRREAAVRDLAAHLFDDPTRLEQTLTHEITDRFTIAPHAHEGILQFDLLVGLQGRAWVGKRAFNIVGNTAMVARPGETHGYELTPGEATCRVYHFKLRVERNWPIVRQSVFPRLRTQLSGAEPLAAAMRGVVRLGVVEHLRPPLLLTRVVEAMCLWPLAKQRSVATGSGEDDDENVDQRMAAAFDLIDQRLDDPPTLDELARAAHFSGRHFARRFRRLYGCTPHTYITARRFAAARQMLAQERLRITHIAEHLGFGSVATFSRWFTQHAGVSPSHYREDPTVM